MELRHVKHARLLFLAMLGATFICLALLIFVFNPLQMLTAKVISIYPGSIAAELFERPPYEILIKVYLFNVSNSEEFLRGDEKLRFNEVGPYTYRETIFIINATFNENGTLTFVPRRLLDFMPKHSIGDPNVDTLLLPNIPLLGLTASLVDSSILTNLAVASASTMFGSTPFLNLTVTEYLYGYDDPLITLANDFVPGWIDFSRFGILDRMMTRDNGSNIVTINLKSEEKPSSDITNQRRVKITGIEKWNGSPGLPQWGYVIPEENETVTENSICNSLEDTYMGTIFPPNIEKNSSFRLYRSAFCRPVPFKYRSSQTSTDGFEEYTFGVEDNLFARPDKNPDNTCYFKYNDALPDGLGDMSPCYYGIPIVMSQPHFLNGDPSLLQQVDGLSPDKNKHDCFLTIHPKMGIPLDVKLGIQVNLPMPTTIYNSKVTPFNDLVIPLFWVDLTVEEIPKQIKKYITILYHVLPVAQQVLMHGLAILGVAILFGSALLTMLHFSRVRHRSQLGLRVNYSEIPVLPLKTGLSKPEILIDK